MMLGVDDSSLNLGVIPRAIAWLYRVVDERRQSTGARFSVRVSAVEVTGRHETVKDLLANVTAGNSPQHHASAAVSSDLITFRVSRRRREMYCVHARPCVCVSV